MSTATSNSTSDVTACTEHVVRASPIYEFSKQGVQQADLMAHWHTIWAPFAELPLRDAADRGAVVAAILTAAIRKWLPMAPAFAIWSNDRGVGKTQLATALAVLAGGRIVVPVGGVPGRNFLDHTVDALRQGADAFLIDDVSGKLRSNALEEFLTLETVTYRRPFEDSKSLSTRIMVLITGNFTAHSDFQRRIVNINLVPPDAYPEKRSLLTRKHCNQHRDAIVTAALATLGAFVATGEKHSTSDRTSYGVWDDLVRGCVLWLNVKEIATAELGDPLAANS